ncbi:hypothetical protein AMJ74_04815 [candidate division WOR_3 bacterium SM1_77]|uniref:Uncharacterized protein n=1 Tax=candidate division WOR_3 bacterium SM1_77 TaxID=1703778 RepID=A0A0S8JXS3_UNCW3|nr:MAG: hypothetical protein AMJ74_04815 [candidate division WOR_3 bacterium SM1_77]
MKINTGCWVDGCKRFDPEDEDGVDIKHDREWRGLTYDELVDVYLSVSGNDWCLGGMENAEVLYEAIEAKLKEKNK